MGRERHTLGGRAFLAIGESTIEQDLHFLALVKKAKIDQVVMRPGESAESYARRLLEATVESGTILDLLGCLLVPEDAAPRDRDPGEVWTLEMGEETARFLGRLRAPEDKATLRGLVLSLLVSFFEHGIVSLWRLPTSSREGTIPVNPRPSRGATEPGMSSYWSSPMVTTTAPVELHGGHFESL